MRIVVAILAAIAATVGFVVFIVAVLAVTVWTTETFTPADADKGAAGGFIILFIFGALVAGGAAFTWFMDPRG